MKLARSCIVIGISFWTAVSAAGCAAEAAPPESAPPGDEASAADEPDEDIAGPEVDTTVEAALTPEAEEDPFASDP